MRSVLLLSSVLAAGAPLSLSPPGPDRHHWRACDSRGPHATPLRSTNSGSVAAVLGRRRIWCAPGHASAIWTNCLFPLLRDSIRASWGGGCSLECCFEAPFVGNSRAAGRRLAAVAAGLILLAAFAVGSAPIPLPCLAEVSYNGGGADWKSGTQTLDSVGSGTPPSTVSATCGNSTIQQVLIPMPNMLLPVRACEGGWHPGCWRYQRSIAVVLLGGTGG